MSISPMPTSVERLTGKLQFVQRDSPMEGPQNVLQQQWIVGLGARMKYEWRDVPVVPVGKE